MSKKKLLPLLALGAAVVLLAMILLLLTQGKEEPGRTAIPLCPVTADAVTAVCYRDGENEATLEREAESGWSLTDDPLLPLDQTTVNNMVESICALQASRTLPADADTSEMGLETPATTITLTTAEGEHTLRVGALNPVTNSYYIGTSTDSTVYLIDSASISGLLHSRRGLYAPQTPTGLAAGDLAAMTVLNESETLTFLLENDVWVLADDPDYTLDQITVRRMVNTICNLQTTWTITAPQDDAAYGLDQPNVVVTLMDSYGGVVMVRFGAAISGRNETDAGYCYLAVDTTPDVVYETEIEHLSAFAYTKAALVGEKLPEPEDDIIEQYPVG